MMLRFCFSILLSLCLVPSFVLASDSELNNDQLIVAMDYFREVDENALTVSQASNHFQSEPTTAVTNSALNLGITDRATWVRLSLFNSSDRNVYRRLTTGQIWVESVSVFLLHQGGIVEYWYSGDGGKANNHLLPEVGFVFDIELPTGASEILIRAQSLDPLTLPIQLLSHEEARKSDTVTHVFSGVLYGILFALVGYNIILYFTLKQADSLYYCLYISCFIVMNLGYSGYAFMWVYPQSPTIQNYCTLFFMVLHGVCGLLFVSNFLDMPSKMPKLASFVRYYILFGISAISVFVLLQMHLPSSSFSFAFLTVTTILMIIIGALNLGKVKDAHYFLIAVCCSMIGLLITTLSVWGMVPYTYHGFNGAVYGVLLEALMLAYVLANRLKRIEKERVTAKFLSSYDPLTQLFNRHAFVQTGSQILNRESSNDVPSSFLIMDVDHFKVVNDTYGHHIGDRALCHVANLLQKYSRTHDIVARWGGEEMVILLPATDIVEAVHCAEQLRAIIEETPATIDNKTISLTASFGIATRYHGESLEQLFKLADKQLYIAKSQGRNRVEPQTDSATIVPVNS